jgi:hypothetical protein
MVNNLTITTILQIVVVTVTVMDIMGQQKSAGRSGLSTCTGVKFDRRNVRASHGLAGVMRKFLDKVLMRRAGTVFWSSADLIFVSRFCQQILSADFSCRQICFCQQILSADFSS